MLKHKPDSMRPKPAKKTRSECEIPKGLKPNPRSKIDPKVGLLRFGVSAMLDEANYHHFEK